MAALALALQQPIVAADDPVGTDCARLLQMKDLIEFAGGRPAPVRVVGRRRWPRETRIVLGPVRLGREGVGRPRLRSASTATCRRLTHTKSEVLAGKCRVCATDPRCSGY
jgi:hypothetical protein